MRSAVIVLAVCLGVVPALGGVVLLGHGDSGLLVDVESPAKVP